MYCVSARTEMTFLTSTLIFALFCVVVALGAVAQSTIVENDLKSHFKIKTEEKKGFLKQTSRTRSHSGPFRRMFRTGDLNAGIEDPDDPGAPVFLSSLIKAGNLTEAKRISRVKMGHRYGHSFAGYITVNENYNSNLYFWFFPARTNESTAPVVVWLQGGPGGSSLFGLFEENGPFTVDKNMNLVPRNYSWNNDHNVIYIDNPVGTGFSFTKDDNGYARNQADVGKDLYSFMTQFFMLFSEFQTNDLYITGESYGGKYVPALTYTIHKNNPKALTKMNLRGMAIGDGLCDPISQMNYGDFLYQIGLVDNVGRDHFYEQEQLGIKYIQQQNWRKAFEIFDSLLNGDVTTVGSYFYNVTGLKNYYNFLLQDEPQSLSNYDKYVNLNKVRKEIHVGNLTFHDGTKVEEFLEDDIMKSVKPWIEEIMNNYKVLLYNGQLDIIVAYVLSDNFIKNLNWKYSDKFQASERYIWKVDDAVAGYVREVPGFAQVLVRDAGHLVPFDQPRWAYELISRFTQDKKMLEL